MRDQFWSILLHPISLSLAIFLIGVWLIPDFASRNSIRLVGSGRVQKDGRVYFKDLNGDGTLERLMFYPNSLGFASVMIHDSTDRLINQWNFDAHRLDMNDWHVGFTDFDMDSYVELSILTRMNDSAFFNIIEPLDNHGLNQKKVFIDTLIAYENQFQIRTDEFVTLDEDLAEKRLYFNINNGFAGYPRNLYSYSFDENAVSASQYLTNTSLINEVADVNGDGRKEILLATVSFDNESPSIFGNRSDSSSWITILKDDLSLYQDPVEVPIKFSSTRVFSRGNGAPGYTVLLNTRQHPDIPNSLTIYEVDGDTVDVLDLNNINIQGKTRFEQDRLLIYDRDSGQMKLFRLDGTTTNLFHAPGLSSYQEFDLEQDGSMEIVGYSYDRSSLTVFNAVSNSLTSYSWENSGSNVQYEFIPGQSGKSQMLIQRSGHYDLLQYISNPMFYWKYPIYAGGFFLIFVLVKIIVKGQELREKRKRKLEAQIAELQLKTIKNQVDPHFVFNAINTISDMTLMEDKIEADRMIAEFSKLMRQTLSSSDKIVHSLNEELNYIRTYIQFQQIRFGNSFEFDLDVDENVSTGQPIPKHLIYTFVENAVKHGLSSKPNNAALLISISKKPIGTLIKIENRGDGVKLNGTKHPRSTGNGILILDRLLSLYSSRFKKKISYKLLDLVEVDQAAGVTAEIVIPE